MNKGGVLSILVYAWALPEDMATTMNFDATMFTCAFGIVYVAKLVLIPERPSSKVAVDTFLFGAELVDNFLGDFVINLINLSTESFANL